MKKNTGKNKFLPGYPAQTPVPAPCVVKHLSAVQQLTIVTNIDAMGHKRLRHRVNIFIHRRQHYCDSVQIAKARVVNVGRLCTALCKGEQCVKVRKVRTPRLQLDIFVRGIMRAPAVSRM
jgi:hypothetical protein